MSIGDHAKNVMQNCITFPLIASKCKRMCTSDKVIGAIGVVCSKDSLPKNAEHWMLLVIFNKFFLTSLLKGLHQKIIECSQEGTQISTESSISKYRHIGEDDACERNPTGGISRGGAISHVSAPSLDFAFSLLR